jgi:hypothetical protein
MTQETIILMCANLDLASWKTGIPYDKLYTLYRNAMEQNSLVVLKIDENGKVVFDDHSYFD